MTELVRKSPWKLDQELAPINRLGKNLYEKYAIAQANPDETIRLKGLAALEAMEQKDTHYASVLQTRKLSLVGKGYEIDPASEETLDQEIAAFVRYTLDEMRGSFLQDLVDICDAMGKGYSVSEINYQLFDRGPYAGKWGLKSLKSKDQENIAFALDEYGNIEDDGILLNPMVSSGMRMAAPLSTETLSRLTSTIGGFNLRLPRDKFLHYVFNARAENPYGRGLGSLCYWYSWFKTEGGFKFWMIFLEKWASPTGKFTLKDGTAYNPDTDEDRLKDILDALQQDTGVIVPPGFELDLLQASQTGQAGYEQLIHVCNAEISKAVLGQTLTTEAGERGARSLGQVHDIVRQDLLEFDADMLESVLNEQLLRPLVRFNFDGVEVFPKIVFPVRRKADAVGTASALDTLVSLGARIPERYIHEELGFPEPTEEEQVLTRSTGAAPGPAAPPGIEPFAERPIRRSALEPAAMKRRKRQAQDDLIEAAVVRGNDLVADMLEQGIDQVRRGKYIDERRYDGEIKINARLLRDLLWHTAVMSHLTALEIGVEELADKGVEMPEKDFEAFAEVEIVGPAEVIQDFAGRVPMTASSYRRLVADLRRKAVAVAGIEEQAIAKILKAALLEAITNGSTQETFAAVVRREGIKYTGRAFGRDLSGQELKDAHLRLIFRNNVMSGYNEGRRALFEHPDVVAAVPAYMYSAIDDDRVRPSHAAMDGRIYRRDDPIWDTWWPPNGHNCRCEVIPVSETEAARLAPEEVVTGPAVLSGEAVKPDRGFGGGI